MNTLLDLVLKAVWYHMISSGEVGQGRPEWGAVKGKEYIVIRLRNED